MLAGFIMPFTFAHPAIVLPFVGRVSAHAASGLVIGSMIPDFEYFMRLRVASHIAHTPAGLLLFCIPTSLAVGFLWHAVVKRPLVHQLPGFLQFRLATSFEHSPRTFSAWAAFLATSLIGSATHIGWDSFTHAHGYAVTEIPVLAQPLWAGIPLYKYLQHGSTLIGFVVIVLFVGILPHSPSSRTGSLPWFWPAVLFGTTALFVGFSLWLPEPFAIQSLGNHLVRLIAAGFIFLTLVCVLIRRHFA